MSILKTLHFPKKNTNTYFVFAVTARPTSHYSSPTMTSKRSQSTIAWTPEESAETNAEEKKNVEESKAMKNNSQKSRMNKKVTPKTKKKARRRNSNSEQLFPDS